MELVPVGDEVFACLQPDTGLGASNSGLIGRGGGLVIDTFYDLDRTRRLMDLYATVLEDHPRRLLNSHHNGDHCWGNQLFAEVGTEIIGHRRCAEFFTREATPELFVALCEADQVPPAFAQLVQALRAFDFHDIVLTPPTTLIDTDTVLDLGPYGLWTGPERLAFQVDRAYREFAGVTWDHPVDTATVFGEMAVLRASFASDAANGGPT